LSSAILIVLLVVMCAAIALLVVVLWYVARAVRWIAEMAKELARFFRNTEQELLPTLQELRQTANKAGETCQRLQAVSDDVSQLVASGKSAWEGARVGLEATKAVRDVGVSAFDYMIALKRGLSALRGRSPSAEARDDSVKEE
jgi:uncharacterized protein YoxC